MSGDIMEEDRMDPRFRKAHLRRDAVVRQLTYLFRRYSMHDPFDARSIANNLLRFGALSESEHESICASLHEKRRLHVEPVPQEKPESWTDPDDRGRGFNNPDDAA